MHERKRKVVSEFYALPLNIMPLLCKNPMTPRTTAIMNAKSSQNPVVIKSGGGKSVRVIVTRPDEVTETRGLVAVAVIAVSQ